MFYILNGIFFVEEMKKGYFMYEHTINMTIRYNKWIDCVVTFKCLYRCNVIEVNGTGLSDT